MAPLDLTAGPPRAPRASLAGITFLPRTIDKFRAALPGGALGLYAISGFSQMMLDELGIDGDAFGAAVASATNDADVARFVTDRAAADGIARWNEFVLNRLPRNGDREAAIASYPWLRERPDLVLAVDVLEEDDRRLFARA